MKTQNSFAATSHPNTAARHLRTACAARLLLLLLALPAAVQAQFDYTTNDGSITITGYTGSNGVVMIPGAIAGLPVTSIGDWAFYATTVTNVLIPDSVTNIGDGAFFDCESLTNVTLGSSVANIGDWTFAFCPSLTSVCGRGNAPNLGGGNVFYGNLATIYYLSGATNWGLMFDNHPAVLWNPPEPFNYTTNSGTITIRVYTGSGGAVTIPGSINFLPVTSIGYEAFVDCASLTSITIPYSVTSLGAEAFYGCSGLTNVTIPDSVINIGSSAFQYCTSLTSFTIPDSVTGIGEEPFSWCSSLTAITVDTNNPAYGSLDGVLFDKSQTTLIQYPAAQAGNYTIPDGVTSIGFNAFGGCTSLSSVTIGNSVTNIGAEAFGWCFSLTAITVDTNNPIYSSLDGVLFDKSQTVLIEYPRGKAGSYTVPDNITNIGGFAFCFCSSLTSVTIPDSVASIGDEAFCDCTSLAGVYFQGNAPSLGSDVFDGDDNATVYYLPGTTGWDAPTFGGLPTASWPFPDFLYLDDNGTITITGYTGSGGDVTIPDTINGLPVKIIGDHAFYFCNELTGVMIPDNVTSIEDFAFMFCWNMTNATIGNGVTSIGNWAFSGCFGLTNVVLPNSLTNIGDVAFDTCWNLTDATIPDSVINIGHDAFADCGLTSVAILDSTTSIGDNAFYNCANLTNVTISSNATNIGTNVFGSCLNLLAITVDKNNPSFSSSDGVWFNHDQTLLILFPKGKVESYSIPDTVTNIEYTFDHANLTGITIPTGITDIPDNMFAECGNLTNVTIEGNVTNIGNSAFAGCASLTGVTIPNSVVSLGDNVFESCSSLASMTIPNQVTAIGDHAFAWCTSLTNITMGSSVSSIEDWAFWDCASLANIIIPAGVTNIGYAAFGYCTSLTNIMIPDSVTTIAGQAFDTCLNLAAITVAAGNPVYSSVDGVLFNQNQTALLTFPKGKVGSYAIPGTVSEIGGYAFAGTRLTSVTIPNSITNIPEALFYYCVNLANVIIPDSITTIGRIAFTGCSSLTSVYFNGNAPSADSTVFSGDNNVTVYYLPGTTGWANFAQLTGVPTALWLLPNPAILNFEPNFGVQTNGFGFTISWATNLFVVVEACTHLSNPDWQPVQTNTLTTGSAYFSDPQWTNYPSRFYRLRSP